MENKLEVDPKVFQIYSLSEQAVTIEFGDEISENLLRQISNFNKTLHAYPFIGLKTTIPAYCTLTVVYDPLAVINSTLKGKNVFEKLVNYLNSLTEKLQHGSFSSGEIITIPVFYGDEFGPDIEEVASVNELTVDEVIRLHTSVKYKVYMIGFVPGFAYLGGMSAKLISPRKGQPRAVIPAGSVGIAGQQTGIYPLETPGGWQIIGKSPVKLFDVLRSQPSLLKAGDEVIFTSITRQEFNDYADN